MSYMDFVEAVAARMDVDPEVLLSKPKSFVLNTNYRGRKMVDALAKLDISFDGKNVLDIGCAYGGMSVEAARQGANVIGVDVDRANLGLAKLNALNDVEASFRFHDATSQAFRDDIPEDWADIIIINDVLEHIYDTPRLLANLRHVSKKGALLYYVVPNGMATRFVVAEGHKKVFGISLAPADCWQFFVEGRFSIFYRRWSYFESLFREFGLEELHDLNKYKHHTGVERNVREGLAEIDKALAKAKFLTPYAESLSADLVKNYRMEAEHDLANMELVDAASGDVTPTATIGVEPLTSRQVDHKYLVDFWRGVRCFR